MITIYSNLDGTAMASGDTLDAARTKVLDCHPLTEFGTKSADCTALDTGPHPIQHTGDQFAYLRIAREFFPLVSATGRVRP